MHLPSHTWNQKRYHLCMASSNHEEMYNLFLKTYRSIHFCKCQIHIRSVEYKYLITYKILRLYFHHKYSSIIYIFKYFSLILEEKVNTYHLVHAQVPSLEVGIEAYSCVDQLLPSQFKSSIQLHAKLSEHADFAAWSVG